MKLKLILTGILFSLIFQPTYSQQFQESCIQEISVNGLSKNVADAFKKNKKYLISILNQATSENPSSSNICDAIIKVDYKNSKGTITFEGFYDTEAFWATSIPSYQSMISILLPYTLAGAIGEYKRQVARQIGKSEIIDFQVKIKLSKEKTSDYIIFKSIESSLGYNKGYEVQFYEISTLYKGVKYRAGGRIEGQMYFPDSLENLNGKKTGTYYFLKFIEAL